MFYVVTMYRWGDKDNHSYVLTVTTKKHKARKLAYKEIMHRGGKYKPEVIEIADGSDLGRVIYDINYFKKQTNDGE